MSVPEEFPSDVAVRVMNRTVLVRWNEAQNVRGLLLGYKVPHVTSCSRLSQRQTCGLPHESK